MRKAQKKQAEDFITLLTQVHEEIRNFLDRKDYVAAKELLGQCQEGAVELGNFVEKIEGEGAAIIPFLENYCELVYQIHEELAGSQGVSSNKVYKKLRQSLVRIENCLKNDIKTRYEIVFMPYKASMWDSLESVWRAASEDPDCDVYVMPIPYYDRNSDHSFGSFHYEWKDFPEDVPVIHYSAYNLEQRRPDIIYIHNPYDENNYVTSVAPGFYSSRLKEYTECLTYIPYCVYEEREKPDSEKSIKYCSRYITNGILNADRVILQSENFRQAIVNTLLVHCGMDRKFWENKILGLGSPKYDKVFDIDRNKQRTPENWKEVVKKADGNKKKVIFYNTSLGALLRHGERMTEKIRSVLQFFYDRKEDCTLLWRPHPLVKATIESMRPELWEEYKEIIVKYREEGWGIYDDTPDFHAAFEMSDAYYGDYSSLVLLYQATGKPLLEQNVEILDYRKRFVADILYYDGEYLWGTAREFNGLFRIDPDTYEIKYMGQFPGEKAEGYRLFWGIVECDGKLYFSPYNAKDIAVYDKARGQYYKIPLREDIRRFDKKFGIIGVYEKCIYFRGNRVHAIIQLNTQNDKIIYIENWAKELQKCQQEHLEYLLRSGCIDRGEMYCLSYEGKGVVRVKLNDLSYEYISLKKDGDNSFSEIIGVDESLWFLPQGEENVLCYDFQDLTFKGFIKTDRVKNICRMKEYVYCFSLTGMCLYRIHIKSKEVAAFSLNKKIYSACFVENKIYMTTYSDGVLYVLDLMSLEMKKVDMLLEETQLQKLDDKKIFEISRKALKYARESGTLNLKNLCEMDGVDSNWEWPDERCGEKIHRYIKGVVK